VLLVEPEFEPAFRAAGIGGAAAAVARFMGGSAAEARGVVIRQGRLDLPQGGGLDVFFKLYAYPRPSWRFWGRPSKALCEYRNYAAFAQLGIRSARRVACGEERDGWGRLRRAFLITQAIPQAMPLPELWRRLKAAPAQQRKAVSEEITIQLAEMTRQAHAAGFFHHDLVWRNVLATWAPPEPPRLWWIDCPRGGFARRSLLREHRRIKDLASLDKLASRECRAAERLLFLKRYLDLDRLTPAAKKLARKTAAYRRRRWPDEWR